MGDVDAELVAHAEALYEELGQPSAREVAEKLIANQSDLVDEWVAIHRAALLTQFLGQHWRSQVARVRSQARSGAFASALEALGEGDEEPLRPFLVPVAVEGGRRVAIGDMTGDDHRFVAGRYKRYAVENQMMSAFHEAVAKKVGGRKTSEVFTEEAYQKLLAKYAEGRL